MTLPIIIAGGGMTGATLALAISHLSGGRQPVHLVEAVVPSTHTHPGFDSRAIALAEGTCRQLAQLGIWSSLSGEATPITQVHVSDRGHAGFVTLSAEDYAIAALGQVVELHEVGRSLFNLLKQAPGVTLHCPARVDQITRRAGEVDVTLDSGERLHGSLLVAADGTRSALATRCGISWRVNDYQQIAVIANVACESPHEGRAWERFTANGPLAMLPMSRGRCSLVWCHPKSAKEQIAALDDAQFSAELQSAFGWRLGKITQVGARNIYPLTLTTASNPVSHRLVLVGNAAQTLHPIAGQGFNLGMRDVMSLAQTVVSASECGEDPGGVITLSRYRERRIPDKAATIGVTDSLVTLFSNQLAPLVVGRNLGLMAMNILTPARDALAYRTLGWVAR